MKAKDPAFITPSIKVLLRRRNKLRKLGRIEQADAIATKINKMIDYNRKQLLVNAEYQDTAKLWSMLRRTNNWGAKKSRLGECGSADDVNNYFATVATDNNYSRVKLMDELSRQTSNTEAMPASSASYTPDYITIMLSKLQKTSTGSDRIPYWFLKACASELGVILSRLINFSINSGVVPSAWKHAIISPVPKTQPVSGPSDLRPISVTPVLSRFTERLVVKDYVSKAVTRLASSDQFAYRTTGSTTCALINITDTVGRMLEESKYVRCLMVDFSKAFDTVDHLVLLNKLQVCHFPSNVLSWLVSFLTDRTQSTTINGVSSLIARITRSIIQGSVIGPNMFVAYIADLKAIGKTNHLCKYADDCTLLVPELCDVSLSEELEHIKKWCALNKLLLNLIKTIELIFRRPNINLEILPDCIYGINRVYCAKLLGVLIDDKLCFSQHVDYLIKICSQRFTYCNK